MRNTSVVLKNNAEADAPARAPLVYIQKVSVRYCGRHISCVPTSLARGEAKLMVKKIANKEALL